MFSKIVAALVMAGPILAAPTTTKGNHPSSTVSLTGTTHSVVAGLGGLHFDPDNVVARVGDVIEWHFLPLNHSIAQSDFANPCKPIVDQATGKQKSFYSGFNFAVKPRADGTPVQSQNVYQIVVEDDSKPIWYYCAQTTGSHCQNGMVGVINQNFNSNSTLAAHKKLAAKTGVSVVPQVQGGAVIPNPNPNGGF